MYEVILKAGSFVPFEELRKAMNAAFSDYQVPMQLSLEAFSRMMRQRGFDGNASTVALLEGKIAAFWLMAIRGDGAYLISSGTSPEFRGKGMSTTIALDVISKLRASNVSFFQTEVLENNEVAKHLYERIGMMRQRHLGCSIISHTLSVEVKDIEITNHPWSEVKKYATSMRDWRPSWQNSDASLAALGEDVHCFCATIGDKIVGVLAFIKSTNTVAQIAVENDSRRNGVGTALIGAAMQCAPGKHLRMINYDVTDAGFIAFVEAHNAQKMIGQFELGLHL